ncbi:hypothetical protein P3T35_004044 [Kitasatospora sp. GP30]|uniref:hypothetical protein n=1 Tax=Kitasatospora sp. GP30 TaxID=3035084 RepID=UPI000C706968|nr:hypothetical protein [Kitasatospora sp. GP30]MDH6142023.1 hypothetical protein [Kitasatospora sp. GP30]
MLNGGALPIPGWVGGDGNSAYLDKTLRHEPVETVLDDRVSGQTVLRLWSRAALVAFIAALVQFPILLFTLFSSSGSGPSYGNPMYGEGGSSGPDPTFLFVMLFDVPLVFWLVLLCSKLTEPIAEWRVLLHDRSEQDVQSTYHKICGVAAQRGFPLGVNYRRLATGHANGQLNSRLALSNGDCEAVISVFRYGTSLYLGWQMWRSRRGWRLIARFLGDALGSIFGKADLAWAMLRTENVRAMREAVHALCREGLVTALEQQVVGVEFGFGSGLPPQAEYRQASSVITDSGPAAGPLTRATAAPIPGQTRGQYPGQATWQDPSSGAAAAFTVPGADGPTTPPSFQPPAQAPIPGPVAPHHGGHGDPHHGHQHLPQDQPPAAPAPSPAPAPAPEPPASSPPSHDSHHHGHNG